MTKKRNPVSQLTESPEWQSLEQHARHLKGASILGLFEQDAKRAQDFSAGTCGLYLDYSKQLAGRETRELLLKLAEARGLKRAIARLFAGEPVNHTEQRAAFHMALRNVSGAAMSVNGRDVMPDVRGVLERLGAFAERVRSGEWQGYANQPITDVVNIGIGGSDLGPRMVCEALAPYAGRLRTHFIANVDGAPLSDLCRRLDPSRTLFIITSKTFTTQETMANAQAARRWVVEAGGEKAVEKHFVAVSTNAAAAGKFGIPPDRMFEFWDWVGGRYSLWSAVGLSIVLALGAERFRELLRGAHDMDRHFRDTESTRNLPVLLGLLGVWNSNFRGCTSHVMAPYSQRLSLFTAWLQQLEMESNGKRVDRDGKPVDYSTTPALWGDVGSNAQHAYFQMLHQGTAAYPLDFILVADAGHNLLEQNRMLLANGLAQSSALMRGKKAEDPHREFPGNRPSNTLLLPCLDPYHLGALLALYEHRTYVQSVIWNINPFDQFGVELGKQAAQDTLAALEGRMPLTDSRLDPSTRQLLSRLMKP